MNDTALVLGLYGSPRRGGNTELLLDEALKGAAEAGGRTEAVRLCGLRVAPCTECLSCFNTGACVIADDMQGLYPRLLEADAVILAAPIFFYGIPAGAKAVVDRCQALWARKYVLKDALLQGEKRRTGFFISVGGTKGPRMFDGATLTVKYFFDAFNAAYAGELLFRGVDACGDIAKTPDALGQAAAAGGNLARGLRAGRG